MNKLTIGAALAVALVVAVPAQAQQTEINFGIISTEASITQKKNWEPFLDEMSKALGLKINGFYASDYAGVIEAMRFNKVHVAWYGNKSAIEAVNRANGEVFAQTVSKDGSLGYYSHLIVHKDSPYTKVEDILKCDKSIDFGIGDPNSTSGFLVPVSYVFAARNIDPKQCFKTLRNANHQANSMAVANKQVAAATNNSEDLVRLEKTAPEAFKQIRVIWTSPIIPLDPIVWRKDLDAGVKSKLYTFLMSYGRVGTPEEVAKAKEVLGALIWSPFHPSSDDQLLPLRILDANRAVMKLQGDDKMSAAEKEPQIVALQAEIKKLQELTAKAETSAFKKRVTRFHEVVKSDNQSEMKQIISDLAATAIAGAQTH